MGYYYVYPEVDSEPNPAAKGKVYGAWLVPNKTPNEANQILAPMNQAIKDNILNWADPVSVDNGSAFAPDFSTDWLLNPSESVGVDVRLASRLLGRQALEANQTALAKALKAAATVPQYPILGHLVAGKGVKNVKIPGGGNSVLPAWRNAYVHMGEDYCFFPLWIKSLQKPHLYLLIC